jgi:hypothetical protein
MLWEIESRRGILPRLGVVTRSLSIESREDFSMSNEEYVKQQFLTLRDEIMQSKARIFWLLIIGIVLVLLSGYLAAEHPNAYAFVAMPFLLIALMLSYVSEQNNIARAGRYLREVEPQLENHAGWERWLETKPHLRDVDHAFVIGFSVLFLIFFAVTTSLSLVALDRKSSNEMYVWAAAVAYALGAFCIAVVLWRHWRSSTAAG